MHPTASCPLPRELAFRSVDGLEVALVWDEGDGQLTVTVVDARTGEALSLPVGDADPLDVFHHPYWYAARLSLA